LFSCAVKTWLLSFAVVLFAYTISIGACICIKSIDVTLVGIAHLFNVYESTPNYTNEEGQMNVADQLAAVSNFVCHVWTLHFVVFNFIMQLQPAQQVLLLERQLWLWR
jgi:hypothetical protein